MQQRNTHGHKLADEPLASEQLECFDEASVIPDETNDITVYEYHVGVGATDLQAAQGVTVLDAKLKRQLDELLLLAVCRDVSHECQVFDKTASFSFGCVRGTKHSPLRRLQRTRTRHFTGFFKLK